MVFSHHCFVQHVYDEEGRRGEACEEVHEGLEWLRMADGKNDGGGVHSKDHARRWDTINNVDMLVMQPSNSKQWTKTEAGEIGIGSFWEFQWSIELVNLFWIVPWEWRIHQDMNLPWFFWWELHDRNSCSCTLKLKHQAGQSGAAPGYALSAYSLNGRFQFFLSYPLAKITVSNKTKIITEGITARKRKVAWEKPVFWVAYSPFSYVDWAEGTFLQTPY